eukprot:578086-Hanusia_phi.AAC.1
MKTFTAEQIRAVRKLSQGEGGGEMESVRGGEADRVEEEIIGREQQGGVEQTRSGRRGEKS